jgi:hypothetical protein
MGGTNRRPLRPWRHGGERTPVHAGPEPGRPEEGGPQGAEMKRGKCAKRSISWAGAGAVTTIHPLG